jgi:hypothetical protein
LLLLLLLLLRERHECLPVCVSQHEGLAEHWIEGHQRITSLKH